MTRCSDEGAGAEEYVQFAGTREKINTKSSCRVQDGAAIFVGFPTLANANPIPRAARPSTPFHLPSAAAKDETHEKHKIRMRPVR